MPNWSVGFAMGILVCLAYDKLTNDEVIIKQAIKPYDLIESYKKGQKDALSTNPVSMELEQSCLSIWANKQ